MSSFSSLTAAQLQAIATALAPASTPVISTFDGAAYYTANCAGCHGALASSQKLGATAAQIQAGIANVSGMSSFSSLTASQLQAIASALTPAATPPPPVTDGATLYSTNCASCHGALAVSAKGGSSAATIQTAINNNAGGVMGSLTSLTSSQVSAIAAVLAGVTAQPAACGSCHAIPPATGKHAKHTSQQIGCATCHGSGYSPTTVNAATHNNGVKNLTTTIGWNMTNRSCSNSCHGSRSW
jgi:mono/diheme cytochrome c family protein